ncbi:MAG TPA: CoA transferase, partial [Myxococcota bacterium]|nr:CoA transferase [Myxococcota bacterium]
VNDLAAILEDPHVRARASLVSVEDPTIGPLTFVAPAPRLSGTPGRHARTGPALGEHNREVYAEWLGLDDDAVDTLVRDEVI